MIENKIALVTGVTRGIGKSILYTLAENGAIVYGLYTSNNQKANEIEEELNSKGYKVKLIQGDVSDDLFIKNLVKQIIEEQSRIDILVNNAGITRDNLIINMPEEDWCRVIDVNFGGSYNCIKSVVPYMVKQKCGTVVNVASVTAVRGREAQSNYGGSKGAIIGLTRMLSRKYGKDGLRFNCVAPGMISTEMIDHVPKDKLDNFLKFTSLDRLGETSEIAKAVLFLADDQSSYLTSTVLQLDGGFIK